MIVADGGEGILPAELDRIFERFRTGSQLGGTRGTGLGLALVRAVARAHGGEVTARSGPGEGSEFELVLPIVVPPPAGADRTVPGEEILATEDGMPAMTEGAGARVAHAPADQS
jgi:K+-sensing histidine kinase KdpD